MTNRRPPPPIAHAGTSTGIQGEGEGRAGTPVPGGSSTPTAGGVAAGGVKKKKGGKKKK